MNCYKNIVFNLLTLANIKLNRFITPNIKVQVNSLNIGLAIHFSIECKIQSFKLIPSLL